MHRPTARVYVLCRAIHPVQWPNNISEDTGALVTSQATVITPTASKARFVQYRSEQWQSKCSFALAAKHDEIVLEACSNPETFNASRATGYLHRFTPVPHKFYLAERWRWITHLLRRYHCQYVEHRTLFKIVKVAIALEMLKSVLQVDRQGTEENIWVKRGDHTHVVSPYRAELISIGLFEGVRWNIWFAIVNKNEGSHKMYDQRPGVTVLHVQWDL